MIRKCPKLTEVSYIDLIDKRKRHTDLLCVLVVLIDLWLLLPLVVLIPYDCGHDPPDYLWCPAKLRQGKVKPIPRSKQATRLHGSCHPAFVAESQAVGMV